MNDDMQRVLYYLWSKVMVEARTMSGPAGKYEVGPDDIAMQHAPGDDILGWVDDCEARLAFDVSNMRAAAIDYLAARDGTKAGFEAHEVDGVLSQALYELGELAVVWGITWEGGYLSPHFFMEREDAEEYAKGMRPGRVVKMVEVPHE